MKLVCIYCSNELSLESSKEDQDKLKNSFWFCSENCKDTFVNIQRHKKGIEEGEKENLQ
jgi:YHS domain-containing protein